MMTKTTTAEQAAALFKADKKLKAVYFATDNQCFTGLETARAHSTRLKYKAITPVYRNEAAREQVTSQQQQEQAQYLSEQEMLLAALFPHLYTTRSSGGN